MRIRVHPCLAESPVRSRSPRTNAQMSDGENVMPFATTGRA
jgi:hypothetical protein